MVNKLMRSAMQKIKSSEITSESQYLSRKDFLQGMGIVSASALVLAAQDWCGKKGIHRLTLEMQPKNYPAIQFAYKLGFEFSGYNDQYYRDQEIAIFFSSYL